MVKSTINEIKNSLQGVNSRITEAEERISDLEDKMVEFTAAEQNKEKRMKRNEAYDVMSKANNPYGDGKACQRIADILCQSL